MNVPDLSIRSPFDQPLLRAWLDVLPQAASVKDSALRYQAVNPAFALLFAVPAAAGLADAAVFPADMAGQFHARDAAVLATGGPEEGVEILMDARGGRHECEVRRAVLSDADGGRYLLSLFSDLTGRRQEDEKVRRTLERLERYNRLMLGREERVLELKREINALLGEIGRPARYGRPDGGL